MRIFTAFHLPKDVLQQLEPICSGLGGARWVPSDNIHLTLCFAGQMNLQELEEVRLHLSRLTFDSIQVDLKEIGVFPLKGTPKSLWVGVQSEPELLVLQKKVSKIFQEAGIALEKRKFFPHITIARLKDVRQHHLVHYMTAHALFKITNIDLHSFSVLASERTPDGSVYTPQETYHAHGVQKTEFHE